jgi:hypothetical protein
MPVTMPALFVTTYRGDTDHFEHVLKYLFLPAVTAAGFKPLLPISTGSAVIQADIMEKLWIADLVLCDISTLNANVFFELGVRTAIDRPVAIVKDQYVTSVPFDVSLINYHSYDASPPSWELEAEIANLSRHLLNVTAGGNTLWKLFGASPVPLHPELAPRRNESPASATRSPRRQTRKR